MQAKLRLQRACNGKACETARPRSRTCAQLIAFAWVLVPLVVFAGGYKSAVVAEEDQSTLTITAADGSSFAAPAFIDQVGFEKARVSPDGKYVGWLALYPNCCTSYPIPLKLVVLDEARRLHTFVGIELAIIRWCLLPGSASVAYMQTILHGTSFEHFEWRAIADGKLLGEYEYPDDDEEQAVARRHAPSWVSCIKE
jgi:hypothetical protein